MPADLPLGLTPDQPDRQATAQLTAGGFVPDPPVEAGPQNVQLGFGHSALHAQHQAVVEQRRMIDAIAIADQRVSEAAEVDEAVPIGIVACQARHFETEDDADMPERDFRREPGEARAFDGAGARPAEVFIDDNDLRRRPAERGSLGSQGILALRRLAIVLNLRSRGLAKINVSCATEMRGADLGDVTHRAPPFGLLWRRLGR